MISPAELKKASEKRASKTATANSAEPDLSAVKSAMGGAAGGRKSQTGGGRGGRKSGRGAGARNSLGVRPLDAVSAARIGRKSQTGAAGAGGTAVQGSSGGGGPMGPNVPTAPGAQPKRSSMGNRNSIGKRGSTGATRFSLTDKQEKRTSQAETQGALSLIPAQKRESLGSLIVRRASKLRKSMAKPFKPGWRPRSTTLRRLPGESWPEYSKRNFWFLVWLFLALLGLILALAAYLEPCVPITTTIFVNFTAPSELMVVLDGSGSITEAGWPVEVNAAETFVNGFAKGSNGNLSAGAVQFSGQRLGANGQNSNPANAVGSNAGAAVVEIPLQPNSTALFDSFEALETRARFRRGGTFFAPGLIKAYEALANATAARGGKASSIVGRGADIEPFQAIIFLSDGENTDRTVNGGFQGYAPTDLSGTYAFCEQHGLTDKTTDPANPRCTTERIADFVKEQGILVKGVFVGDSDAGAATLCGVSQCNATQCAAIDGQVAGSGCRFFTEVADLAQLQTVANELADSLQSLVPSGSRVVGITTGCADARWFALLLLALPLLWYLLFLPIMKAWNRVLDAREEWAAQEISIVTAQASQDASLAKPGPDKINVTMSMVVDQQPVAHTMPVLVDNGDRPAMGKRYKWKIEAADRYLWAMGGAGNAPLRVNFGAEAPPSAPKQHEKTKKVVEAKLYEFADAPAPKITSHSSTVTKAEEAEAAAAVEPVVVDIETPQAALVPNAEGGGISAALQESLRGCCRKLKEMLRGCCLCFCGCLGRFINDLAHFVAFYCPRCVGCCIEDEHEERIRSNLSPDDIQEVAKHGGFGRRGSLADASKAAAAARAAAAASGAAGFGSNPAPANPSASKPAKPPRPPQPDGPSDVFKGDI